jgi:hypothetical protein
VPDAVLVVNGTTIDRTATDVRLMRLTAYRRGGCGELAFARRGLTLSAIATPDPWWGQSASLAIGGTTYFVGQVGRGAQYNTAHLGWVREYTCRDLRNLADFVPVTDSNTGTDRVVFNQTDQDVNRILSRTGRTVGQMVLEVLEMPAIRAGLSAAGVGGYTSAGSGATGTAAVSGGVVTVTVVTAGTGYTVAPKCYLSGGGGTYTSTTVSLSGTGVATVSVTGSSGYRTAPAAVFSTLPTATLADLDQMVILPPYAVHFAGEKVLAAVDQVVLNHHRSFRLWVRPDGVIRFLDERAFTNRTVTLNSPDDPANCWDLPSLTCDWEDSYQRVQVRGDEWVEGVTLGVLPPAGSSRTDDGINETRFAHDSLTVAAAKAAWTPAAWTNLAQPPGAGAANTDRGTCTCSDTLHVVMTDSDATRTYAANYWDQTSAGHLGVIEVASDVTTGVAMKVQCRIIGTTALTAGGTYTATLDQALPSTSYNTYRIYGMGGGAANVWTLYQVSDAGIAAHLRPFFPYGAARKNSDGTAATRSQSPVATVFWSLSGSPPYTSNTCGLTVDPDGGTVRLDVPAPLVIGNPNSPLTPADVQVYVPVSKGPLLATWPADSGGSPVYSGDSYALGLTRTKYVTVREWRDPGNSANMLLFAHELYDAVSPIVWEGRATYRGLNTTMLTFGQALEFTGVDYTTGLESTPINVASCSVEFNEDAAVGTSYTTVCELSNRRAPFTGEYYFRPSQTGSPLGQLSGSLNLTGYSGNENAGWRGELANPGAGRTAMSGQAMAGQTSLGNQALAAAGAPQAAADAGVAANTAAAGQVVGANADFADDLRHEAPGAKHGTTARMATPAKPAEPMRARPKPTPKFDDTAGNFPEKGSSGDESVAGNFPEKGSSGDSEAPA